MTDTWTTTPPTEPGLYWALTRPAVIDFGSAVPSTIEPHIMLASVGDDDEHVWVWDQMVSYDSFSHWCGPLPVPAPPEA